MGNVSVKLLAENLGKDISNLAESVVQELETAIANTAYAAYASIIADAQAKLDSTRLDYLKNLDIKNLGDNNYLITLSGDWANKLETGFPGFDLKETLLASKKIVQVGSRAGKYWVQNNKVTNTKFARVPFEHHPFGSKTANQNIQLQNLTAFSRQGIEQKLTKTFKDDFGKPLQGKVATARSEIKNLDRIVKFQQVSDKGRVSSIYMTWRTISENSKGWLHPGYVGGHFFEKAEAQVEQDLIDIINLLVK